VPLCLGSCSTWGLAVRKHRHLCGVSMSQVEWRGGPCVVTCWQPSVSWCKIGGMAMIWLMGSSRKVDQPDWSGLAVSSDQAHPLRFFALRVSRLSSCSLFPRTHEARGIPVSTEDTVGNKMKTSS